MMGGLAVPTCCHIVLGKWDDFVASWDSVMLASPRQTRPAAHRCHALQVAETVYPEP